MQWILSSGLLAGLSTIALSSVSIAQIVPDATFGSEQSTVTSTTVRGLPSDLIRGGAIRGSNLFHSFSTFNVSEGRGAYFANPDAVQNIFARVTGERSQIFGRLGVLGDANLFLINPNGVIFEQNSSLDVNGSLVVTTADAVQFGDRGSFSATSPGSPASVLTVDPSAFVFSRAPSEPPSIAVLGSPFDSQLGGSLLGLRVPFGRNLVLLGGNVKIQNGSLQAFGGSIQIGAVRSGSISIASNAQLSFPENLSLGDVSFSNAIADVRFIDGGEIAITARNIRLREGSTLIAGSTLGIPDRQVGDITLRADDTISIIDSQIFNTTASQTNGGAVNLYAANQVVSRGGVIVTNTSGGGNAGSLLIDTDELTIVGSAIGSATFGEGNSGDTTVEARRITIQDGGFIAASAFDESQGKGGNLTVTASEQIELIGTRVSSGQRFVSGLSAETTGTGDAGTLRVNTGRLVIRDGASIRTETSRSGRGGDVIIHARDSIEVTGGAGRGFASSISSETDGSTGDAGNLTIQTTRLSVQDGAVISSGIRGDDNNPDDSQLINGAGGNLKITADQIDVSGTRSTGGESVSSIVTFSNTRNEKATGDLDITTRQLRIRDGGKISTGTQGFGNAGSLRVFASDTVEISGISASGVLGSELSSGVISSDSSITGQGGNLRVDTNRLIIREGGTIFTATVADGKAGDLSIFANDVVIQGGTPSLFAEVLGLRSISAQSLGRGQAGTLSINAANQLQLIDSAISTSAPQSAGGNIQINTAPGYASGVTILRNSDISTASQGNGGDITIGGLGFIAFGDSNVIARSQDANGGNITFNTAAVFLEGGFRPTPRGSETQGNARIDIDASGQQSGVITLRDNSFIRNSLIEQPQQAIDTQTLIANSCIVRDRVTGSFFIKGRGGLPIRPGDLPLSPYTTGMVQAPTSQTPSRGDPTLEPQAAYQLPDGKILLSRECSN
ncbi:filamentous haemagglutinin outer membrane protein [Leptolyngbya sp. NIES-3755]|nr:filamentous haemagglutinin outer membrane protein [Leptolyngbya sp. NIES-3755]